MNIVFPLIGISLTMALIFLGAFVWSVRSGQQDDMYTPSVRILFEDENVPSAIDPEPPVEIKKI